MTHAALVYNVTTKVSPAIHTPWLQWMRFEHVPAVLATGCFFKALMLKLKTEDEEDGITYTVQYFAETEVRYEEYIANYAHLLRQEAFAKWGNEFISFRTVMQVVDGM